MPTRFAFLLLLLVGGALRAAPLPADAKLDDVLDALDQRGKTLKSFQADVKLTELDDIDPDGSTTSGTIYFDQQKESPRMRVTFTSKQFGKVERKQHKEYVLDGQWLRDADYDKKILVNRQLLRPGEKANLLKLGEGPVPLPIGQDKEEVKKQFDASTVATDAANDPDNTVHVRLVPKKSTSLAKKFAKMDVWVDRTSHMPARIEMLEANEINVRITDLTNVVINPTGGIAEKDLALSPVDEKTWNVSTDALED